MGMPAVLSVNGTGSAIWTPDWGQPFFIVGFGVNLGTAASTTNIDFTYDDPNTVDVNGVASPHWINFLTSTATATTLGPNTFTSPCQAFRINVVGALATSIATVTFVQSTFGR